MLAFRYRNPDSVCEELTSNATMPRQDTTARLTGSDDFCVFETGNEIDETLLRFFRHGHGNAIGIDNILAEDSKKNKKSIRRVVGELSQVRAV